MYALPGDTIEFDNKNHEIFLEMGREQNRVRRINDVREKSIAEIYKSWKERQK